MRSKAVASHTRKIAPPKLGRRANTRRKDMGSSHSRRINRRTVKLRQTKGLGLRVPLFLVFASLVTAIPAILINLSLEKWSHQYHAWRYRQAEGRSLYEPAPKLKWDWSGSGE
jgi:hypothetical protein